LDRHCRESKRKEKRLISKIEDKERKDKIRNKNWESENSDEERSETIVEKIKR